MPCHFCDKEFINKFDLENHQNIFHQVIPSCLGVLDDSFEDPINNFEAIYIPPNNFQNVSDAIDTFNGAEDEIWNDCTIDNLLLDVPSDPEDYDFEPIPLPVKKKKIMPTKRSRGSGFSKNKKNAERMRLARQKETPEEHDERVKAVGEYNKKRKADQSTEDLRKSLDLKNKKQRQQR